MIVDAVGVLGILYFELEGKISVKKLPKYYFCLEGL